MTRITVSQGSLDESNLFLGRLPSFGQFTSFRNFISDVGKNNPDLTPCRIKSFLPQGEFLLTKIPGLPCPESVLRTPFFL